MVDSSSRLDQRMTAPPAYSPSLVMPATLDARTVGNEQLINAVVTELEATARSGGSRFELLLGPPGSGKTHVLRSIYHRVRFGMSLGAARLVMLPERAVVASPADLLALILADVQQDSAPDDDAVERAKRVPPNEVVGFLGSRIAALVAGKPLVVFVESLGIMLNASVDAQHSVRALLQHQRAWSVITTGTSAAAAFTSAAAPLFGMFRLRKLHELTVEECHDLRGRQQVGGRPTLATTRTLHHLLGGWPRPMVIAQKLTTSARDSQIDLLVTALCEALEPELLCAETHLPHGRKSVFRSVANCPGAIRPSDIGSRLLGISREAAATQLKILRDEGLVRAHTVGRSSYHELAQPVHRFVAACRARPTGRLTFARYLRTWYADERDGDPRLRGRTARTPADALLSADFSELTGIDRDVVTALVQAVETPSGSRRYVAALGAAKHAKGRCSAAERALIEQCLVGIGRPHLLD